MAKQILFIGREDIVSQIKEQAKSKKTRRFMFIEANGGIGKSRLIQEIHRTKIKGKNVKVFIDFDDLTNRTPENLTYNIANELDVKLAKLFRPYLIAEIEYREMAKMRIPFEELKLKRNKNIQVFSECFNKYSTKNRVIIFFDTMDKLNIDDEPWATLKVIIPHLNNCLFVFAGRNAEKFGQDLSHVVIKDNLILKKLEPLSNEESSRYIKEKQKQLKISVESDVVKKIVLLAGGIPILIDLAVEWRSRGISLDWLGQYKDKDIDEPDKEKLKFLRKEFERQLLQHMQDLHEPIDRLSILMTRVYPVNENIIKKILNENDAKFLVKNAADFVFIKNLPEKQYTLHDKMREILIEFVIKNIVSINVRMSNYSEQMIKYCQEQIDLKIKEIQICDADLKSVSGEDAFNKSREINELEQRLWIFREHLLTHRLYLDINKGIEEFINIFNMASKESKFAARRRFIDILNDFKNRYAENLSGNQIFTIKYYNARQLFDEGKYAEASELCQDILKQEDINVALSVQTLMLYGNCYIRIGKVNASIPLFETAVETCEHNKFSLLEISAKNTLGWSYRLIGDLELALKYYQQARKLCIELGIFENEDISYNYGLIMNNYAYVLSDDNSTRKAAIDIAHLAVDHWKQLGNNIGLGAAYLVLGIAFYRSDHSKQALEAFDNAMNIFGHLNLNDWLGQIYSWRGAQYHDMQKFDDAEREIRESIKICSPHLMAMNLNRLGRIYMNRHLWDEAEKYMHQSLDHAKKIPDYVYWLGSIARLASIAAKKFQSDRYNEFKNDVNEFIKEHKIVDKNSLGIAYLSLAKLAFLQNKREKIEQIVENLEDGIPLITEHGSFARTDYKTRLDIIQEDFDRTDYQIIREVGQKMIDFIEKKEKVNINYTPVLECMYKWSNWKGGNN